MSEVVNQSLQKIARGTAIVFFSTIIGMPLAFGGRVLMARFFSQSEYGIFSLAWVILNITVVISTLGFQLGTTRQIAYYRGKADAAKIQQVISSSLQMPILAGVLVSLILFFVSNIIATQIFHEPELAVALKILSIAIPFFALINILTSLFQGFDQVKPKAYFQDILKNGLFPLLLLPVIFLGLSFSAGICAFAASIILTGIAFAIYTQKRAPFTLKRYPAISPAGKELLLLSLPLLVTLVVANAMTWIDTVMLGYFMAPGDVGLYNAALPLVRLLGGAVGAVAFLYIPLASQLYARGQKEEIKRNYVVLTKWIFAAMLPVFLIFVLFPGATLNILFGSRYMAAAPALQILSLGLFVQHNLLGLGGVTLIAMGETRFVMWASVIIVIADIALNVLLIPPLGIIGAATATASAVILGTLVISARLYLLSRIHPFTMNYLKPAIVSLVLIFGISGLVKNLVVVIPTWLLLVLFVAFLGIYALSMLFTRSFDKEDIAMLLTLEDRLGINLGAIKRILRRFV